MQPPKKTDIDTANDVLRAQVEHYIDRARLAPTRDVMHQAITLAKQYAEVCEWLSDVRGDEHDAACAPNADTIDMVAMHLGECAYALYCIENKTPAQCEQRQSLVTVRNWLSWMANVAHERRDRVAWIDDAVEDARRKARIADPKARID